MSLSGIKHVVKTLSHPYHSINILFSLSFMAAKLIEPVHNIIFPYGSKSELDSVRYSYYYAIVLLLLYY